MFSNIWKITKHGMEQLRLLPQSRKTGINQQQNESILRDAHLLRHSLQALILFLWQAEAGLDFAHSPHPSLHIVIKSAIINM